MPRQLDGTSLWRKLTAVELIRLQTGTIGDTTTTAPVLGDGTETTIGVTAITNFTATDIVLISGDGGVEALKIGTPNVTMPVTYKPKLAQATGARFVEAAKVSLGKIGEAGFSFTPSKPLTPILSAVDDGAIAFIDGTLDLAFSVPLLEYSGLNHQLITGYADAETGTGTPSTDPYQYVIGAVNQTLQGISVARLTGIRHDGKYIQIDMLDMKVEPSGGIDHNRQGPAVLVLAGRCTRYIVRQATAAFTGN